MQMQPAVRAEIPAVMLVLAVVMLVLAAVLPGAAFLRQWEPL